MKRILAIQTGILAVCLLVLVELAANFPWPSPFIRPFLPAKERWPAAQVVQWVETQKFDPAFVDFFNRDPERKVPAGSEPVSPADGLVKATLYNEDLSELVIGLSFWDVHIVRTPLAGIVKSIEPGGHIDFRPYGDIEKDPSAKTDDIALRGKDAPVQAIITVATDHGDAKIRMITSYWASRLRVWVHQGEHLQKGQRIGRILLGSTVAVAFPGEVKFSVRPNERVFGGETIISKKPPEANASQAVVDPLQGSKAVFQ